MFFRNIVKLKFQKTFKSIKSNIGCSYISNLYNIIYIFIMGCNVNMFGLLYYQHYYL